MSTRMYWSFRRLNKRCRYVCKVSDADGWPQFSISIIEHGFKEMVIKDASPKGKDNQLV